MQEKRIDMLLMLKVRQVVVIDWSETPTYNSTPLRSSSFQDILPPFPVVKNPDNLIITFDVNFKTKISNLEYLIFYFQDRFY